MDSIATVIDTDIGDDVDDAFALALALRSPELRVVGVTTVAGPVERRARLAQTLLAAVGRSDIPVAVGSSARSDGRAVQHRFSHAPVVAPDHMPPLWCGDGCDLLRQAAAEHASAPLRIICLGPLTNLALALQYDPSLATRVRVVAMGGKRGLPYPDWNIRCDPAAARRVLASGVAITLVGMHVTMQTKLTGNEMAQVFDPRSPLGVLLARCVLAWRTPQRRMPILHDALAVAVAYDPSLAWTEARRVIIGPGGFSFDQHSDTPNARVCRTIDLPRWRTILHERVLTL